MDMMENRKTEIRVGCIALLVAAILVSASWAAANSSCPGMEWRTLYLGQTAKIGDWSVRPVDISVVVGEKNEHPAIVDLFDENGVQADQLVLMPNSSTIYTRASDGKSITIKVGLSNPGMTLASKWVQVWVDKDCSPITSPDDSRIRHEYVSITAEIVGAGGCEGRICRFEADGLNVNMVHYYITSPDQLWVEITGPQGLVARKSFEKPVGFSAHRSINESLYQFDTAGQHVEIRLNGLTNLGSYGLRGQGEFEVIRTPIFDSTPASSFDDGIMDSADCTTIPRLEILTPVVNSTLGRVEYVDVRVSATQPASCGRQDYGVDFTDAYDARYFVLGMEKSNTRFLFSLSPGESKTFRGVVGIPLGTPLREHRLQMTAYSPADIWKQTSANVTVQISPLRGNDMLWRTNLTIGWNIIPSEEDAAFLGCDDIQKAYRYSTSRGDYVEMERFGAQFIPMAGEPDLAGERTGGLAVFSRKRCTMSIVADSGRLSGQWVSLASNQERAVTVPYTWYGKTKADLLAAYCSPLDAGVISFNTWDAKQQRWILDYTSALYPGQVLQIKTRNLTSACTLPLGG